MPANSPSLVPISTIGKPNGFTLVEMMVVLFIAGLMAGIVLLNLPGGERALANDAEQFAARLAAARDMAILRSGGVAVQVDRQGYRFEQRIDGAWHALPDKRFAARRWSAGTVIAFPGRGIVARVYFDSTGFPSAPLDIDLSRDAGQVMIRLSGTGEVSVAKP